MTSYKIKISPEALSDIQEASNCYNKQVPGLGSRYQKNVKQQIEILKKRAEGYSVRYEDVHCVLVKKFPFLIHFTINKEAHFVEVFAVFHTSRNPTIWHERKGE
ncbi:type II toxin-antitoxin system RelE/ParE family toxin [Mucilaginibacter calamicampi]|uniref:Type II toxin-antitoxin system RelE/ParE family toxin n=1 Tax=Mucilaginibacter calamicampi TaxID=1302352 RepID=A0ABW2YZI2_9SPHI